MGGPRRLGLRPKPQGGFATRMLLGAPPQTPLGAAAPNPLLNSRSDPERSGAERSEAAGPEPTQPNWIQTNLETKRRDQTGGLIES